MLNPWAPLQLLEVVKKFSLKDNPIRVIEVIEQFNGRQILLITIEKVCLIESNLLFYIENIALHAAARRWGRRHAP